jgi:hypothetical protein
VFPDRCADLHGTCTVTRQKFWFLSEFLPKSHYLLERLSLAKGKETENGLHSKIDHDRSLRVNDTEVYIILHK